MASPLFVFHKITFSEVLEHGLPLLLIFIKDVNVGSSACYGSVQMFKLRVEDFVLVLVKHHSPRPLLLQVICDSQW